MSRERFANNIARNIAESRALVSQKHDATRFPTFPTQQHPLPPSVEPCRNTDWMQCFDTKAWTLAILPYLQLWPGYAVRDPSGWCAGRVADFAHQRQIEEIDVTSGSLANAPRKGKYNLSISIQGSHAGASKELIKSRELTAKHGTRAILTSLTWVSKMIIGPEEVPDIFVLDGEFPKTLAWFVFGPGRSSGGTGKWQRLAKGK